MDKKRVRKQALTGMEDEFEVPKALQFKLDSLSDNLKLKANFKAKLNTVNDNTKEDKAAVATLMTECGIQKCRIETPQGERIISVLHKDDLKFEKPKAPNDTRKEKK